MTKQQKEDIEMNEGRRESDHRFSKIEESMKEIGKDMVLVKTKIYNGMGTSIKSTENKVDYIDQANKEDHGELKESIKDLSKKFDKILWFFGVGTLTILLKDFILGLL